MYTVHEPSARAQCTRTVHAHCSSLRPSHVTSTIPCSGYLYRPPVPECLEVCLEVCRYSCLTCIVLVHVSFLGGTSSLTLTGYVRAGTAQALWVKEGERLARRQYCRYGRPFSNYLIPNSIRTTSPISLLPHSFFLLRRWCVLVSYLCPCASFLLSRYSPSLSLSLTSLSRELSLSQTLSLSHELSLSLTSSLSMSVVQSLSLSVTQPLSNSVFQPLSHKNGEIVYVYRVQV